MSGDSIEVGDKVSWNWNSSQPGGTVAEVKEGEVSVTSHRGNEISKTGDSSDPAVHIERPGNDVVKLSSELNVQSKGDGQATGASKQEEVGKKDHEEEKKPENGEVLAADKAADVKPNNEEADKEPAGEQPPQHKPTETAEGTTDEKVLEAPEAKHSADFKAVATDAPRDQPEAKEPAQETKGEKMADVEDNSVEETKDEAKEEEPKVGEKRKADEIAGVKENGENGGQQEDMKDDASEAKKQKTDDSANTESKAVANGTKKPRGKKEKKPVVVGKTERRTRSQGAA